MNLSSKTELELYFADHFDTVLFSVLADMYLQEGDTVRSRKVCDIGLDQFPAQPDGLFILAEVDLAEGNDEASEKGYKSVLKECPDHLNAAVALAKIQTKLGRASGTVTRAWKTVHQLNPHQEEALQYFDEKEAAFSPKKPEKVESGPLPEKAPALPKPSSAVPFSISPRLATFTMVAILRNQGLGEQALEVLKMLEEKGEDSERIERERNAIKEEMHD